MRNPRILRPAALAGLLLLAACAPPRVAPAPAPPETGIGTAGVAYVYDCGAGDRFSVRVTRDSATLRLGARSVTIPQVVAASGTRYEGQGIIFWSKGLEAMLEMSGASRQGCIGQEARTPWVESRLLGYDFRAVGQEPGWMVEIDDGKEIHLSLDYGERQIHAPAPAPITSGGVTTHRTRAGTDDLTVTIRQERCVDTMSGEEYPASVTLRLGARDLQGCGRKLEGPAGVPLRPNGTSSDGRGQLPGR